MNTAATDASGPADPLHAQLLAALGRAGVLDAQEAASRVGDFLHRPQPLHCRLLARPANTQEVATVMRLCHAARCEVVAHGGRTGLVHGSDSEKQQVVLSLERMNAIETIDTQQRVAVAQAGVTMQALQEAAQAQGLQFALDLGARGSATLGGNAATNAGGNRVIRYGMMRQQVLGLEAVLADGTIVSSLNRMLKNNAGYDLKQVFIGSEGTLGIITRLVLRLTEMPASQNVAFVAVPHFAALTGLLKHMDRSLGGGLSAFEAMWREFYELVSTPPALSAPPLPHGHPFYALLESQGGNEAADRQRFEAALEAAMEDGLILDAAIASSQRECAALWGLRDDVVQLSRDGVPFAFDVSLPIAGMQEYTEGLRHALAARWPQHRCWIFGHLGDGNLHVVVRTHPSGNNDEADREAVERIVYTPLQAVGGSVSAEHGVGLEKKPWLHLSRTSEEIALMRALKHTLDPLGLLNPGKIF